MKRISTSIAAALLICAVSAVTASAKVRSRSYSIGQDFTIAGTAVKAGTYLFSFDDEKNELTVINKKTKEVIAKTEARAEAWGKGTSSLGIQVTGDAAPLSIAGIAFDKKQVVRVASSASAAR